MARVTWTVNGSIKVEEADTTGSARTRNLENVHVRVSGSQLNRGGFKSWGTTRTNSRGNFSLSKRKDRSARRIRVEVRFKDEDLEIGRPITATTDNWIKIYETSSKSRTSTRNIGTRTFRAGRGGTLGDRTNVKHATWWYAVKKFMDRLDDEGAFLEFRNRIHISYPENIVSRSSWAEAITRTAHIHRRSSSEDHGNLQTVFHEVMHLWDYQHNSGTRNWICAVFGPGGTHDVQEQPNIAFAEGFAEYAAHAILHELWGRSPRRPMNRQEYARRGLTSLSMAERNDDGVTSMLRLLTASNPYALAVNGGSNGQAGTSFGSTSGCPSPPGLDLWDVLRAFEANARRGWSTDLQVGRSSYGARRFLDRMTDVNSSLTNTWKGLVLDVWDPAGTTEFRSACD